MVTNLQNYLVTNRNHYATIAAKTKLKNRLKKYLFSSAIFDISIHLRFFLLVIPPPRPNSFFNLKILVPISLCHLNSKAFIPSQTGKYFIEYDPQCQGNSQNLEYF